jgi:hypothetical protein
MNLNEFICNHYTIKGDENLIFVGVMGPFNGTRLFITPEKLECAGKRWMEIIQSDMLRYMTAKAASAILTDYKEFQQKAQLTPVWKPTWFEKQIILSQDKDEQEQEPQGRRKKTTVINNESTQKQEQTNIHIAHKQQATKVLSEAAMTNEERRLAILEQAVAELQTNNMDVKTMMGEIKETQH